MRRLALCAVACAISFVGQVHWRPAPFAITAEIKTNTPARLQLRYNRGYGNRQEGTTSRDLAQTADFVRVRFPIETSTSQGLRLVNLGFGRELDIRSLRFQPLGAAARQLTAADLTPNSPDTAETRISQEGDIIHVESNGTEPLVLHLLPGSRIEASRLAGLLQWIFVVPLCLAAMALLLGLTKRADDKASVAFNAPRSRSIVVATLILGYLFFSAFGLNGSSTALWRYYADRELPTAGVLAGTPKEVRSDEWMLQTPWLFSQAAQAPSFSVRNPSIGSDVTPLVTNLPVRHWSTIFRPQMWPFFFLNVERAFAFYWNFKSFALLLGAFLFFGVLTGGKTLLDLGGALFVAFSPFLQWWLSTPTCLPEMLAMFFFALWLIAVVARSQSRWRIFAAGVGLVFALPNFVFCCYPRFQIPLVYLGAGLLLGGLALRSRPDALVRLRLACLITTTGFIAFLTWLWWREVAEVIRITALLSYPGLTRFTGGGFEWNRFLDPFLEFSMTGDHFPEKLENACEAAGFLFVAPFLLVPIVRDAFRRRVDLLVVIPLGIAALTALYMTVGVPLWAAKISGWAYVSSGRANLLVGVASAIALVRFLSREKQEPNLAIGASLFGAWLVLLIVILKTTNVRLGHFEASSTITAAALFFAVVALCIWTRSALVSWVLLLIPQIYACALVNPIVQGVPGLTQSRVLSWLADAHRQKPDGNWVVLGDTLRAQVFPDFVKATGAHVLGGMRCNPDYDVLKILDPTKKYVALTDRYAWIHFKKGEGDAPIFEAAPGVAYDIRLPLTAPLLDDLGVKHILEVDLPDEGEVPPGFHLVETRDRCRLLERD